MYIPKVLPNYCFEPFSKEAIKEARDINLSEDLFHGRELVNGLSINKSLVDDQGNLIWLEKKDDGYMVTYMIPDLSDIFDVDSELDFEARKRLFVRKSRNKKTIFPKFLLESALALLPNKMRLSLSIKIIFDSEYNILEVRLGKSKVSSIAQTTWEQIDTILYEKTNNGFNELMPYFEFALAMKEKSVTNHGLSKSKGKLINYAFHGLVGYAAGALIKSAGYEALFYDRWSYSYADPTNPPLPAIQQSIGNTNDVLISFTKPYDPSTFNALNYPFVRINNVLGVYGDMLNSRVLGAIASQNDEPFSKDDISSLREYFDEYNRKKISSTAEHVLENKNLGKKGEKWVFECLESDTLPLDYLYKLIFEVDIAEAVKDRLKRIVKKHLKIHPQFAGRLIQKRVSDDNDWSGYRFDVNVDENTVRVVVELDDGSEIFGYPIYGVDEFTKSLAATYFIADYFEGNLSKESETMKVIHAQSDASLAILVKKLNLEKTDFRYRKEKGMWICFCRIDGVSYSQKNTKKRDSARMLTSFLIQEINKKYIK